MNSQGKAKVALTFAVYQGDRLVRRDTIAQEVVKVGKDARSHLRVEDELASRMHAVIEVASPADITLIDLWNEPGTFVNGQRVNKCKVHPGDQIQIGSTLIVLESAEPVTAPPAEASFAPPPAPPSVLANPFAGANPFDAAPSTRNNPFAAVPSATANRFAAARAAATIGLGIEPPMDGDAGGFTYAMVKSGPDIHADEVEVPHLATIEVMILWGANVLHVSHLTPPHSFYVGEVLSDKNGCDYFIPSETLGTPRAPIVVSRGVGASLVILAQSDGYVVLPGEGRVTFSDLVSSGRAWPSSEMSGAYEFELPAGAKARMELVGSALVFQVSAANAGKKVAVGFLTTLEPAAFLFTGMSFLLHAGLVALFAFFMPTMKGDTSDDVDRDQILVMQKLLNTAAMREQEQLESQQVTETAPDQKEGGTGEAAKGEAGSLGTPNTKDTGHRYGVQGPQDNPDPHLAKQAAIQEAAQFGVMGLIATMGGGDPKAPTAAWGAEESLGRDEKSALGKIFGDNLDDSSGARGLDLSGVGEGGGGPHEGIGLRDFGSLGNGPGPGTRQGIGNGRSRPGEGHQVTAPKPRPEVTVVNGRLAPEIIQRIVRQNFGRFRFCYENGLRNNPNLQGRVAVKFIVDRNGAVATTADGGSDLPDQTVVECVVRAFGNLSFPQPESGRVTVVYPITFSPAD
jgi:hypothetical protein